MIRAVIIAGLLSGASGQSTHLTSFDFRCEFDQLTEVVVVDGGLPQNQRVDRIIVDGKVDLGAKKYCFRDCSAVQNVAAIEGNRIYLSRERRGTVGSMSSIDTWWIDTATRQMGGRLDRFYPQQPNVIYRSLMDGICIKKPFTGLSTDPQSSDQ